MNRIFLAAIFLLFHASPVSSEESIRERADAQDRPRIGLVLSGGGARGAAHIGILKFLEEQNIPVDYVAGTSMGAVVGGLYASGMTAEEIETMTRAIDWGAMFRDDLSPAELPIRRKVEGYQYLVDVEAGYRDGQIVFPTGFLRGQRLNLLLRKHMLPVRHIRNFDALPTPFRAVATDLANARAVTFREGDIVTAMRASMSVPGVFNPVEYDGTRLVDGGLVENLPIPTAREFQPDILIVVDVTTPLDNVHSLASPFEVTSQVIDGVMLIQSRRLRKEMNPQDLLVLPQLGGYTSASFDDIGDIIDRGYAAARAQGEQLRRLSVPEPLYADYVAERRSKRLPHPFIADILVDDNGMGLERLVKARIGQRAQSTLDVESLESDLQKLYGLQLFDIADYEIEPLSTEGDDEGRIADQLVIKTQPKETGPLRFELGFELVENFEGDTAFELSAATKVTNLNALGAEWRTEFGLGELTGMTTEFYQPVDFDGRFFVSTHYTNGLARILRADPSGAIAEYSAHLNQLGLDLGWNLTEFSALRVGVRTGTLSTTLEQGDPALFADQDFDIGDLVLGFRHDSMDSFSFPSEGSWIDLRWEKSKGELGADEDGEFVSVDALKAVNWFKDNLLVGISAQSVVSGNRFEAVGVRLGGFTQLSGFERDELVGQHSLLARAIYYRYLGSDPDRLIDLPLYAGMTLEAGNVWQDRSQVSAGDMIGGASLFVALDTFLGPVSLSYGYNTDGEDAVYLSIGTLTGPSYRQFDY